MRYPKIIHQTYKDENIPDHWKISPIMWKKMHPDYVYMFWTDADIRNYIKSNYPDFLNLHDNYIYNIQRADMIRYFILYDFGGIYSDLDLYPNENIEPHLSEDISDADVLVVNSVNLNSVITNSFMISKKKAPIWRIVHEKLKEKLPLFAIGKHLTVMYSTGPLMLTSVFMKNKKLFKLLPVKKFMAYSSNDDMNIIKENAVLIPLKGQSWNGWDSKLYNFANKHKNSLIRSLVGKTKINNIEKIALKSITTGNCDMYISFYCKNMNSDYIKNLKKLDYVENNFCIDDDKNVTITFNHKDSDAYKLVVDISGLSNGDNSQVDVGTLLLCSINSKKLLSEYINNKFLKSSYLNYKNTSLNYDSFHLPLVLIKEKMKKYNYAHTSSFLFSLTVYAFWKKTASTHIKCGNIYLIPFLKDDNKILDNVFFVSIENTHENVFDSIYSQIKCNTKSINDMLGLNSLLNLMKHAVDKKQINSGSEKLYSSDVVFSNLPMKIDVDDLRIVYKQSQPEKMYCFCIGNKLDDIMFSLVFDESLNDVQNILKEIFNSL